MEIAVAFLILGRVLTGKAAQILRVLKIEGEKSKDVVRAKDDLAGDIAMHGDQVIWTAAFSNSGYAYQKLTQIRTNLGVVIVWDKTKSQIRLYGSEWKCMEAQKSLAEIFKGDTSTVFAIDLDAEIFQWACNGGFNAIGDAFSEGAVAFDMVSTLKRIQVMGSEGDLEIARSVIVRRHIMTRQETNPGAICAVCWTDSQNPVQMKCCHVYCVECFEHPCRSRASAIEREGRICCQGDQGMCEVAFSLEEIQEHLSSAAFEGVLEDSFASYIRRHPQDFRYCPTPDCSQVYRGSSSARIYTCSKCLCTTCTSCNIAHDGMPCAEYKDRESGGIEAFQRWKQKSGVKDCPKCQMPWRRLMVAMIWHAQVAGRTSCGCVWKRFHTATPAMRIW